tara:strand:- start:87 stop:956 length:870 start_codon:yes stop_codon:yes gene_type:complete
MNKSIINLHADDLGRSKNINLNIFKSVDKGFVTGVSIMTNHKHSIEGIKGAKKRRIKMRLHLNLTEGKSLFSYNKESKLVNEKGIFSNSFLTLLIAPLKPNFTKLKKDTKNEIDEQIKLYLKYSKLTKLNLDGHQHIHCIPWISNILIKNKSKFKINEIRIPNEKFFISTYTNLFKPWYLTNIIKFILLKYFSHLLINKFKKNQIKYNDFFIGLLDTGHMNVHSIFKGVNSILKNNNHGLIEILIHPGKSSFKEKKLWESHSQHLYYTSKERFNELVLSQNKKIKKIIS